MSITVSGQSITYQEIVRQQKGWKKALAKLESESKKNLDLFNKYKDRTWVFTGCGTSYYLAQTASTIFEMLTGIHTKTIPASEILIFPKLVFNPASKYLIVPISRSGESTEVVLAAQKARDELKIPTLAVSCNPDSKLVKGSEHSITFPFEKEKSVVMTGSFTTMLLSVVHLASLSSSDPEIREKLLSLADASETLMRKYEPIVRKIVEDPNLNHFVFLGQGPFLGLANEAALKIQEMSISLSQSYHALEYRHGPKSTAAANTLITLLLSEEGKKYESHLAEDLKALGAKTFILQGESYSTLSEEIHDVVNVPSRYGDVFNAFLYMPLLQLLGYYKAIAKNINPDNPKNLSAVVTFETIGNGKYE
ncbi:MAG: SIS domain-containing protein [Calditrichia bacterium]